MSSLPQATDANFKQEVLESKVPVLVDFWAEWCGPCRALGPIVEELAKKNEGRLKVLKCDIDSNPKAPEDFGIQAVPTMILFKDGKKVSEMVGLRPEAAIQAEVNKVLA
jgi:thioredoxin 1